MTVVELSLRGPAGEPVDLWRTILSHGVASLPPMFVDGDARLVEVTLPLPRGRPRTVRIRAGGKSAASFDILGRRPGTRTLEMVTIQLRRVLALDQDLSPFYDLARRDPALAWAADGAGRMVRSVTVFEDVVKTICTTNCSWALTRKMVDALVEHLGDPAEGAPVAGTRGRIFPTAHAMASRDEAFYRDVVRAGYRSRYFVELARTVASGDIELESLCDVAPEELSDEEMAARLIALPGVGPYAAAHIMMMLGRHSFLILDSWTRPTYARLVGRKTVSDRAIERRFRPYGRYAGLAFWLFLTRSWVDP